MMPRAAARLVGVAPNDDPPTRPSGGEDHHDGLDLRGRLFTRRTLLSLILAGALLFLLFRVLLELDPTAMLDLFLRADPLLLAGAFVAHYLTFPLRAWRWRYLLGRAGQRVGFRDATEIFSLSWFVNVLAPARLGDLYRAYLLRSTTRTPLPPTFGTLLIERAADILGVFVIAVAAGFWSFGGNVSGEARTLLFVGIGLAAGVVLLTIGLIRARRWLIEHLPPRMARAWAGVHDGAVSSLTPRAVVTIGAVTGAAWLLEGLRLYLVVASLDLAEIGIGFSTAVFVALIAAMFSILPLTPAGIGFVEAGAIYALTLYGVPSDAAATAALMDRSITLVSVLLFGSILYAASRKARRGPAAEPA
jgi:glycosyltransferase 2 family protein